MSFERVRWRWRRIPFSLITSSCFYFYIFFSRKRRVSGVTWTPIHISSLLTQFITHTHTETMFALQSQIAGAKVVSQVVAKKQQRSTVANAKMAHGKGTLRQRNFVFERRTNHHHNESSPSLDWITAKRKFFLHHCVFSRGSIVFFSFRFPPSKLCARTRARFVSPFIFQSEGE